MYCLNQLWTRPQLVLVAQSFYMQKAEAKGTGESPDFFKTAATLAKIDISWLASWIGGFLGYPMEIMQRMVAYDADCLLQLVEFMAKVGRNFRLPKACVRKEVLRLFLEERIKEVGARPNLFKPGSIDDKGRISWDKGCYKFVWEEGLATHVVHVPSNTKVPLEDHTRIKKDFVLSQNHSDCSAVVSKGVSKYTLSQFFGDDEGPSAIPTWIGNADRAAEALAEKFQDRGAREVHEEHRRGDDRRRQLHARSPQGGFEASSRSLAEAEADALQEEGVGA